MTNKRGIFKVLSGIVLLAFTFSSTQTTGKAAFEPILLRLKYAVFNPAQGDLPDIPPDLQIPAGSQDAFDYGYYIVQFSGPIQPAWVDDLTGLGAEVLDYIPDFAFNVRMSPQVAGNVVGLSEVIYVGSFQPAFKLSPDLVNQTENLTQMNPQSGAFDNNPHLYTVRIEPGADLASVVVQVAGAGIQVIRQEGETLIVSAQASQLAGLANILDVAWIESFRMFEKHNEYAAGAILGANTANGAGYNGSSQILAIADTGLGGGAANAAHPDIPASRIQAIYNWPGTSDTCWTITNDGSSDVDTGHGTHTSVSAVGDGTASGLGKGTAPAAKLVFQAVENWAHMIGTCASQYQDGYYLVGIPGDLRTLFQQAYNAGARIHSDSWGSDAAGDYTSDSVYVDDFIWNHKDMLITFSAGNNGVDANGDGVVDNGSIGSPATAKDVLSVGASENDRQGNYQCDTGLNYTSCSSQGGQNTIFTYGTAWPSDFPANPLRNDPSAGNAEQMAAFSSRGPTNDGRIKPDVVAPGTWVLSGYSNLYQQGYDLVPNPRDNSWQYDGWGYPFNQAYKYMGGTSMANPLVAGGAAVVRDFYQKVYSHSASAALVKAALINSAVDLMDENNDGHNDNDFPIPNSHEGWGRVNLANATDGTAQFVDEATGVSTGGGQTYTFPVTTSGSPFKVTLVWSDYPSTSTAAVNLVNDLDLVVTSPTGTVYRGNVFSGGWSATGGSADRRNVVENVYVQSAGAGTWTVRVSGYNIPHGPQPFALVVDGNLSAINARLFLPIIIK